MLMNKEYDLDNKYSVLYLWGSIGIGINVLLVDLKFIISWVDLWDLKWKNKFLLIDDVCEVFYMVLKINGYLVNLIDFEEIKQVYEKLKQLMLNVLVFNGDVLCEFFMVGDVSLGMIWNGEVIMV